MLAYLKGRVILKKDRYFIIENNGIGYKVFASPHVLEAADIGKEISLWIHTVIREDAQDLYGFNERSELEFYELLLTVSGIGPRTAIGIMSVASVSVLKRAVFSGNTGHLTKIVGIGKKVADKIVLELQGKVADEEGSASLPDEVDALEALKSLGYKEKEARDALKKVEDSVEDTGERIKRALKILGSHTK